MANGTRISELFEKQAKSNPFAKAVLYHDQWITYQALDKQANQFSHYLQSIHQIKSGDIVGLSVEDKNINLLSNEILEVVSLESGKPTERLESFNLRDLITHNIELLLPVAKHKKLDLLYEISQEIPSHLNGLRIYLDRILLNLISNALKFTENGFVKISVKLEGKNIGNQKNGDSVNLKFLVEDSGIGIPKDKFDTIFEHFSRLTPAYEGLYKGAGLGLYTVKRYIEAMKGYIYVDSKVGEGTFFTVILPFTISDHADREKSSVRPVKKTQPKTATFKKSRITALQSKESVASVLIVEDQALAAMAVQVALKSFKCAIEVAENGAQAVEMAQRGNYDLILMDIGLPDFSGVEATKKIRALSDPSKSAVPIVALTGHANNPEKRKEAIDAGMQEVMSKPAQPLALEAILQCYVFKKSKKQPSKKQTAELADDETEQQILMVIDWDACIRMCRDDSEFTHELLSMLADDLQKTKKTLATYYANKNNRALRDELHRVRGGVCYLKVPQLENALKIFHEAVKEIPQNH